MRSESSFFQRARYISSVSGIYLLTLLFACYAFYPLLFPAVDTKAQALKPAMVKPVQEEIKLTSGTPVRIVVPSLGIDLPVDIGTYNPLTKSWTLSRYRAFYADITAPANDYNGNTFIYGHRNTHVFYYLYKLKPSAEVLVYTSNNHIFAYKFTRSATVAPDDVSIFNYSGPPVLTLQTCTGNWNEWRQLFNFDFEKVVQ